VPVFGQAPALGGCLSEVFQVFRLTVHPNSNNRVFAVINADNSCKSNRRTRTCRNAIRTLNKAV